MKLNLIQEKKDDLIYAVESYKNHFFIHTNDKSKNFRLCKTLISKP